ncbi:MAG: ankyrin repeat domain-containing protein [Candidatus Cardinium sp.]|uniref:ankyrin repeat domain-containing protein n=1 Tax=Candidatus Cardinium sp. TP TaxID=2961955 RepID=UPI0021AE7DE1|nr:ankyrin repeat domain-containing protein [Candidatus Cardinium sp. TP]MCT4696782.1 ankyrin repeat domain-containing protein [Candidatus Cardinium sp. TP]
MPIIHNNGTGVTTPGPFTSTDGYSSSMLNNRTDITHLEEVVTKALEKGEEEWGNRTTTENPSTTTKKPSRKPSKKPSKKPSTTTSKPSTTTVKPDDGVPPIKDPMVLDEQFIAYTKDSSFSEERVQYLLDQGLKIDANNQGSTLLIYAAFASNKPAIRFLVERGAKVDAQTSDGLTALMIVAQNGLEDIVDFLLEKGANPCIKDKKGQTVQAHTKSTFPHIIER